jgi:putative oxidoreductase
MLLDTPKASRTALQNEALEFTGRVMEFPTGGGVEPRATRSGQPSTARWGLSMQQLAKYAPQMLSILRIVSGLIFFEHGLQKLVGFPPYPAGASAPSIWSTMGGFGGLFEFFGGILLILGLFTRPVAFILAGEMAVAYWWVHGPRNFFPVLNGGDAAILYCFVFLYMFFAGGGPWSVDALWRKAE